MVCDIGASVGIHSLLASSRVGSSGRVYSFEPLSRHLRHVPRHVALSGLTNCTVIEEAVCNKVGTLRLAPADWEQCMGRLSPSGKLSVPTTTIDACIYRSAPLRPPNVVTIDVEGAENAGIEGGGSSDR